MQAGRRSVSASPFVRSHSPCLCFAISRHRLTETPLMRDSVLAEVHPDARAKPRKPVHGAAAVLWRRFTPREPYFGLARVSCAAPTAVHLRILERPETDQAPARIGHEFPLFAESRVTDAFLPVAIYPEINRAGHVVGKAHLALFVA